VEERLAIIAENAWDRKRIFHAITRFFLIVQNGTTSAQQAIFQVS
jgi:hypothetical protein